MADINIRVHILLPKSFVKLVDDQAGLSLISRSDFIRLALMEKLAMPHLEPNSRLNPPLRLSPLRLNEIDPLEFQLN